MRSFLLFCLLVVQVPFVWAWQGVVDQVIDGDLLKIRHDSGRVYDVRLYGVDSPERAQAKGIEAKNAAEKLVGGKSVDVQVINVDQNGTAVSVVYVNDQYSLQAFLVGSGWAWVYEEHCELKICKQWQSMQTQAKTAHRGLWADSHPVPPWKWRQQYASGTSMSGGTAVKKRRVVKRRKTVKKTSADISAELQTSK